MGNRYRRIDSSELIARDEATSRRVFRLWIVQGGEFLIPALRRLEGAVVHVFNELRGILIPVRADWKDSDE